MLKWTLISLSLTVFILFVMLPVLSLVDSAFDNVIRGFIDAVMGRGSLNVMGRIRDFIDAVTEKEALNALGNSLFIATLATIINLFAGTLIAFTITRYRFPGASVFRALIDLPIAIPAAVVGLAIMMLYGPYGFLGPTLDGWGIDVVMALPGVLVAHVFVTFPFMVRSVSVALEKLDRDVEDAAKLLGARRRQVFFRVILPSIRRGLLAGSALTFTRSLGEFGATLFIAGGMLATGPLQIYYLSDAKFDFQAASAVAVVLMVFPFLLLLGMNALVDRVEAGR